MLSLSASPNWISLAHRPLRLPHVETNAKTLSQIFFFLFSEVPEEKKHRQVAGICSPTRLYRAWKWTKLGNRLAAIKPAHSDLAAGAFRLAGSPAGGQEMAALWVGRAMCCSDKITRNERYLLTGLHRRVDILRDDAV